LVLATQAKQQTSSNSPFGESGVDVSHRANFTADGTPFHYIVFTANLDAWRAVDCCTAPPPNRAPTASPGGPYTAIVNAGLTLNGSASSDPDGDALTFAWDFGDDATGVGSMPLHTYTSVSGSPYTVTLAVSDGALSDTASTTATVRDFLPANVFYLLNLNYIFPQILPTWVRIEPINGSFAINDVIASSVTMSYNGVTISTGCKNIVGGDRNHNGVPEIRICFARNDLGTLFTSLPNGTSTVEVTLEGGLMSGGKFRGTVTVHVIKFGFLGAKSLASISPNPLNPNGRLTFVTTAPGLASVKIFDPSGRMVRNLMSREYVAPGAHEVAVDGRNEQGNRLASGVYFFRVESVDGVSKGAFTILK
jgi:PKD repeat protein